jgi:YD repeat-containing protein
LLALERLEDRLVFSASALESVGSASIPVVLSQPLAQKVTISYAPTGGSARRGIDYFLSPGKLSFQPGETLASIPITLIDNTRREGNRTVEVSLSAPAGAKLGSAHVTFTILDDDPLPSVAFTASASAAPESKAVAILSVALSNPSLQDVTVHYTVGGTATFGSDHRLAPGSLTFKAGQTRKTLTLPVINDAVNEPDETVVVSLFSPVNAVLGAQSEFTYTITNDDPVPSVGFTAASSSGPEIKSPVSLQVQLSAASSRTVTVPWTVGGTATGGGFDYTLAAGTLTFAPGEVGKPIVLPITADAVADDNETVVVTLGAPANAVLGAHPSYTYTIRDSGPSVGFEVDHSTIVEGTQASLAVVLNTPLATDVSLHYAVTGGSATGGGVDDTFAPGKLTIPAGQTRGTITIPTIDDMLSEGNETVQVTLSAPINALLRSSTIHTLTILDNDPIPTVSFTATTASGSESATSAALHVSLSAPAGRTVTVPFIVGGTATFGKDHKLAPGVLTFPPGATSKVITLPIINDMLDEADETVIVTLGAPTGALLGAHPVITYTIGDDDPTPSVGFTTSASSGPESNSGSFTVALSAVSGRTVSVPYRVSGTATPGVDYMLADGTLTFAPGQSRQTVVIPVIDDALAESAETVTITLTDPTNAVLGKRSVYTYTILDNDPSVGFDVLPPALIVQSSDAGLRIDRNAAVSGSVTDALSGVASVEFQVDASPFVDVPFTTTGAFSFRTNLPVNGSGDGPHTVLVRATDRAGNVSTATFTFTLDTPAPATLTLDLDPASDSAPIGDRQTSAAIVNLTGVTEPDLVVTLAGTGRTATADDSGRFTFSGIALSIGANSFTVRVADAIGNVRELTQTFTRLESIPPAIHLAEGNTLAVETAVPVVLGQAAGTRSISFDVAAHFDRIDQTPAVEDLFLVYLVDPADRGRTLLSGDSAGTALFSLAGTSAEYTPGQVHFDGTRVTIDVTSVSGAAQGSLVFQLHNSDGDTGTTVDVTNITDTLSPAGVGGISLPMMDDRAAPGPALDPAGLTLSMEVELTVANVRFDPVTDLYSADFALRNDGPAIGRQVDAVIPGLPVGVDLVNRSGTDAAGEPYLSFRNAIIAGGLATGAVSAPVEAVFRDPSAARFRLLPQVFIGTANRAPQFDGVGPLTVHPVGRLEVPLHAVDPDGDLVTFSLRSENPLPAGMLTGGGTLVFTPAPADLGSYSFTLAASDGALETTQQVTLTVSADPVSTTRLSGVVENTNGQPLAGVPVTLGDAQTSTAADGSFQLTFPDTLPAGPLEIHGDEVARTTAYNLVTAAPAVLLGHDAFLSVNNEIGRPIFLTPLDQADAVMVDPVADTTVTTPALPGASLYIAAGTLTDGAGNRFAGPLALTETPLDHEPVALPQELTPDLTVFVGAGDLSFSPPAPLTLPNRTGWAPGVVMDLWELDPATGSFLDVGAGKVSSDGTVVQTVSGGARATGLHFFTPRPDAPLDPAKVVFNEDTTGVEQPATTPLNSGVVDLDSGAVIQTHDLVTYQSIGQTRGLSLRYDSLRADPRPIIHFGFPTVDPSALAGLNTSRLRMVAQLTILRGNFAMQVPGFANAPQYGLQGNEHFWVLPADPGQAEAALQANLSTLPSGVYDYQLTLGLRLFDDNFQRLVGSATTVTGRILHINSIDSPLGSGWGLAGIQQIVENPDGSALLVDGDASELLFGAPPSAGQPYTSPVGDFSTLEKVDDGSGQQVFRRTLKDQTVYLFDADNRLVSVTDRNGNKTAYSYDLAGRLTSMTDPANLRTTLTYNGNTIDIVDPANRLTRLVLDDAGNLTQITEPDGSKRTFGYDGLHHLTSEIGKSGNREETDYGFHGRALRGVRTDGSIVQVAPVQVKGLFPPEKTDFPFTAPSGDYQPESMQTDGNGDVEMGMLDEQGQYTQLSDALGAIIEALKRGNANLPDLVRSALGNTFRASYDAKGNPIALIDQLSALVLGNGNFPFAGAALDMKVGDFNGDGIPDVVVVRTKAGYNYQGPFDAATVYFGDGHGSLTNPADLLIPYSDDDIDRYAFNTTLEVGDFNGDGRDDIVLITTARILTFLGGDLFGGPIISAFVPAGFVAASVPLAALGDMDGDKRPDLVLSLYEPALGNGSYQPGVQVMSGRGDGLFAPGSFFPTGAPAFIVQAPDRPIFTADLDRDGRLDVLLEQADQDDYHFAQTLHNDGTGRFTSTGQYPLGTLRDRIALGDVTGDGYPDVVAADLNSLTVNVFPNDGHGAFPQSTSISSNLGLVDGSIGGIALGDVNGDGHVDLVAGVVQISAEKQGVGVYLGNGKGRFSTRTFIAGIGIDAVAVADMNIDGKLDFVSVAAGVQYSTVSVRLNDGQGNGGPVFGVLSRHYTYDSLFNQLMSETDDLGRQTLYTLDAKGNRLSKTQLLGAASSGDDLVTDYTYTSQGLVATETDPLGRVTATTYNAQGLPARKTIAAGTAGESVHEYEYDLAGNRTADIEVRGSERRRTEYEYDAMNRLTLLRDPLGNETRYTYDDAGNQATVTDARGNTTTNEYDGMHRMTRSTGPDPDGPGPLQPPITEYKYDDAGNLILTVDPLGRQTRQLFDSRNHLVEVIDPKGGVTRYEYDSAGNQIAITDPDGNRSTFTYDGRNRMTSETDPLGNTITYEYDAAGERTAKVDRDVRRIEYKYDDFGRLKTETWVVPNSPPANVITSSYDDAGNLKSIVDYFSSLSYTYDDRNRMTSVDNAGTPGAPHVVVSYTYSGDDLVSVSDTIDGQPDALNQYKYDALHRVIEISQSGSNVSDKRVDWTYDPVGLVSIVQRFADLAGMQPVVHSAYTYDAANQLVSLTHSNSIGDVAFYRYTYDEAGQIVQIVDIDGTTTYQYDPTGQLIGVQVDSPALSGEAFSYDLNGNRTNTSYITGPDNRLISDGEFRYEYDNEGNLIRRIELVNGQPIGAVRQFVYDYHNRLTSVTDRDAGGIVTQIVHYTYDALDRRIARDVDTTPNDGNDGVVTHFVYDREDVLLEFVDADGSGPGKPALSMRYLHGPGIDNVLAQENYLETDASLRVLWLLPDRLGSTRDLVDNSGTVRNHFVYDAFGQVIFQTNPAVQTRYLFTGREFDAETGLYYFRARYYLDSATFLKE